MYLFSGFVVSVNIRFILNDFQFQRYSDQLLYDLLSGIVIIRIANDIIRRIKMVRLSRLKFLSCVSFMTWLCTGFSSGLHPVVGRSSVIGKP